MHLHIGFIAFFFAMLSTSLISLKIIPKGVLSRTMSLGLQSPIEIAQSAIKANNIMIFSKSYCPYCKKAKKAIEELNYKFSSIELDERDDGDAIQKALLDMTGQRTVPNIFVKGTHIGGCDNTLASIAKGEFQKLANN